MMPRHRRRHRPRSGKEEEEEFAPPSAFVRVSSIALYSLSPTDPTDRSQPTSFPAFGFPRFVLFCFVFVFLTFGKPLITLSLITEISLSFCGKASLSLEPVFRD